MARVSKNKKRFDGRKVSEIRNLKIKKNVNRYAEGSCLIEMGNTHVLCLATVEEKVPRFKEDSGEGWVTAEYAMLPRSTHTRMSRESVKGKVSGRTQEISRLIGRALRAVVDFKKLGERSIFIDCEVIQADGGTRCAAITGAYVALAMAVKKLLKEKILEKNPLTDHVAAISVGVVDGQVCLDLCYEEDSSAEVDLNLVATGKGKLVEIQGTAEAAPFSDAELAKMLKLAKQGVKTLIQAQKKLI